MAYVINKFNGAPLVTLQDAAVDTTTSLSLVGRSYVGYGEIQNENFVHLMENFANKAPPSRPLKGQTWFDTENNILNVYNGENWSGAGSAVSSNTPPENVSEGSLWFNSSNRTLHIWNGTNWSLIGPETADGFGITRARSGLLLDSNEVLNPVIFLTIDESVIAIVSSKSFTVSTSSTLPGFNNIKAGITASSQTQFSGDLAGVSDQAIRLKNTRTINGIEFNGTENITVKSSTTEKLIIGNFLKGEQFDGSKKVTIAVDATSDNLSNKIVARDANGNFSAGIITARFINSETGESAVGFTGSRGATGVRGVTGFTGSQGDVGFTGSRGSTGFTGSQGVIGFTGSRGVIGFTGSQGPKGDPGDDASGTPSSISATDNNSSTEIHYPVFLAGTGSQQVHVTTSTRVLSYQPSTGVLNSTHLNSTSDIRLKENVRSINNALSVVSKLRGVRFQWKEDNKESIGVIAQEVEKILPEVVSNIGDYKSVSYGNLVGVLIEAIKEISYNLNNPARSSVAMMRRNTDLRCIEVYDGTSWVSLCNDQSLYDFITANFTPGGGDSFNGSTNQSNSSDVNQGYGKVAISLVSTESLRSTMPVGGIIIWSGAIDAVPFGWALCNGQNGTPDLRDRFVVGAGSTYNPGNTAGSKDAIAVAHTYSGSTTGSSGNHEHFALSTGNHTHLESVASTGSSGNNANLPPYLALAFIMKLPE